MLFKEVICYVYTLPALGWRWHKWMAAIFTAVNFLVVVFFVPETRYVRDFSKSLGSNDVDLTMRRGSGDEESDGTPNVTSIGEKDVHYSDRSARSPSLGQRNSHGLAQIPKKTWLQEMSLWSGTPNTSILKLFLRPFPLIVYPAVIYAFLAYAVSLAWVVSVNILNSFVLEAPPYNWGTAKDGLINIPGFIGNVVGSFLGGWLVDRYCDWHTRKNGGVFQPESRLFLLTLPFIIVPVGCIVFGFGVQNHLGWFSLFFSYGMISVGLCAVSHPTPSVPRTRLKHLTQVPTITMTYISDCYLPVAADALLLVNGLKNIVAFGFLYGVVPWVTEAGYVNCFGTQAGVFVAIIMLGLPLWRFGARVRHASAQWRIILL